MRHNKFRVWDTKNKKFLSLSKHKQAVLLTNDGFEVSTGWDSEDFPTFGETAQMESYNEFLEYQKRFIYNQHTTLKDKQGVPIYEGDIVEMETEFDADGDPDVDSVDRLYTGEIILIASQGVCMKKPKFYDRIDEAYKKIKYYKPITAERTKVIGNIYENPELLDT